MRVLQCMKNSLLTPNLGFYRGRTGNVQKTGMGQSGQLLAGQISAIIVIDADAIHFGTGDATVN